MNLRQQRFVAAPVVDIRAGHRHGPERPAVERSAEREECPPAGDPPRKLERRFDRLRTRVEREHRVERFRERRRELMGEADHRLREADGAGGDDELVHLLVDRRRHCRVVVAQPRDRDPVREIQVGLAFGVEQPMALAMGPRALEVAAKDRREIGPRHRGEIGGAVEGVLARRRHGCPRWRVPRGGARRGTVRGSGMRSSRV